MRSDDSNTSATAGTRTLPIEPLTPEAFAPFGFVAMAHRGGETGRPVNHGTARRFDGVGDLANLRPGSAHPNLCMFRCQPYETWPLRIEMLEKHPHSTQLFISLNATRYLVIVAAPNDAGPDPSTLRAFLADGRQGVAYGPGVWHHTLIALDRETDFACIVYEDGSREDCIVATIAPSERPIIDLKA